jgi:hypothetical protein
MTRTMTHGLDNDNAEKDNDFATQLASASTSSQQRPTGFPSPSKPWKQFENPNATVWQAAEASPSPPVLRIYYATRTHSQIAQVRFLVGGHASSSTTQATEPIYWKPP